MEGVKRYHVRLLPHNPDWSREFNTVKTMIQKQWGDNLLDIQHVGSTAIPGICAKPILDIAVRLRSISGMNPSLLEEKGYSYCGIQHGDPLYHLFVLRSPEGLSLHHIHCYDMSSPGFGELVGFRDYLNTHPETADAYAKLKYTFAEKYKTDRAAYTKCKQDFILSVYDRLHSRLDKIDP